MKRTSDDGRPLRIAIVGAGAVGLLLGARLARAGQRVAFVARGERLRALRASGLRAVLPDGVIEVAAGEVEASDSPAAIGVADVVLLCTKTYDLAEAALASVPLAGPGTAVVPVQNGVEADAVVRTRLPLSEIAPGAIYVIASSRIPGEVRQSSAILRLVFGRGDAARTPALERLEIALQDAGIEASLVSDITGHLWEKLVMLASIAGLTCLADCPIGALRGSRETRALLEAAMLEVVAVARAQEIALPGDAVARAMSIVDSLPPEGTSSMHEDRRAGRRLEIESLSGAVVRLGRERGVETPIHRVAYACLATPA